MSPQIASLTPSRLCVNCNRRFLILKDGTTRRHKCNGRWTGFGPAALKKKGLGK